jgi:hypothetical protein
LSDDTEVILGEALTAFAQRYGEEAVQAILSYRSVDFDQLPE